uniref:Uncharacterized protein n=1 Tax=Romanomermis culicivorax TaxID=13658 RepID=A0A915KJ28_ROMCU
MTEISAVVKIVHTCKIENERAEHKPKNPASMECQKNKKLKALLAARSLISQTLGMDSWSEQNPKVKNRRRTVPRCESYTSINWRYAVWKQDIKTQTLACRGIRKHDINNFAVAIRAKTKITIY